MRRKYLYPIFICLFAILIIPCVVSAQSIFGLDFESSLVGDTSGPNWTTSTGGSGNAQVVNLMGPQMLILELSSPPVMSDFAQLVAGPINMSGYSNKQVTVQWEELGGIPFTPSDFLTFEVAWTGPSPGTDSLTLDYLQLNSAPPGLNPITFNYIPDNAVNVTLTVTSQFFTQWQGVGIDNINFNVITPVPTISMWGVITFIVLAGIGAIYYLRRKKIES